MNNVFDTRPSFPVSFFPRRAASHERSRANCVWLVVGPMPITRIAEALMAKDGLKFAAPCSQRQVDGIRCPANADGGPTGSRPFASCVIETLGAAKRRHIFSREAGRLTGNIFWRANSPPRPKNIAGAFHAASPRIFWYARSRATHGLSWQRRFSFSFRPGLATWLIGSPYLRLLQTKTGLTLFAELRTVFGRCSTEHARFLRANRSDRGVSLLFDVAW